MRLDAPALSHVQQMVITVAQTATSQPQTQTQRFLAESDLEVEEVVADFQPQLGLQRPVDTGTLSLVKVKESRGLN